MIQKIDIDSVEFQNELDKTKKFTDKVCNQFGFEYNPNQEVNEGITMGLSRNKMIYGKYYCPCFIVQGKTKEEQKAADNRICPCKPALKDEIPNQGSCHCGIFCTPQYVKKHLIEEEAEIVAHDHSRGLTKAECEELLSHKDLDGDEIDSLLEARELGMIEFLLVDVREWMEWVGQRIKGTDHLIPTTSFYDAITVLEEHKDTPIILYCFTGSRSAYCQQVMGSMGYKSVSHFARGIISYSGQTLSGEQ
jgi:ferredoxin-thioredoxin reductase catalytic subunit/rhodanese-related sulfurtransferase